jgi:putative peptidoglycan lipid II flippase
MGPMILGMTVTQINTLADDIIGWLLSSSAAKGEYFIWLGRQIHYPLPEDVNAHLYFSQRLYQMPLGVLGISLATAIFPVMSAEAAKKDYAALLKIITKGLRGAVFIALPATAGLILIRDLLVTTLFERGEFTQTDSVMTASVLSFYSLGLCGFFLQQIVTRAFYSLQDSKMPARTAVITVLVNIILNLTLIWFMATTGLALATAICSYLQVAILMSVLGKRFDGFDYRSLAITATKSTFATAVMYMIGIIILKSIQSWPDSLKFNAIRIFATVTACALAYILAAWILRVKVLRLFIARRKN